MRVLLSLWGMQIHTAESATAAEHLFRLHGPPDILIVDLRLDGSEHGAHLAGRLLRAYGEFSVMIITGETSSEALGRQHRRLSTAPEADRFGPAAAKHRKGHRESPGNTDHRRELNSNKGV